MIAWAGVGLAGADCHWGVPVPDWIEQTLVTVDVTAQGEFQVNGDEMIGPWARLSTQTATPRRRQ